MNFGELVRKFPFPVIGTLVGLLLLGYAFFRGSGEADAIADLERLYREANRVSTNAINSSGLAEQLKVLQAANKAIDNRVAKAVDLAGNSQYFYRLEAETGVKEVSLTQISLKTGVVAKGASFVPVPYNVIVQGKYPQVLAFLQKLEGAAWFGRVTSLTLRHASEDKQPGEPILVANCMVELLAQP